MANTIREKELKREYPVVSGLDADSKHEGRQANLVPEQGSLVPERFKKGIQ